MFAVVRFEDGHEDDECAAALATPDVVDGRSVVGRFVVGMVVKQRFNQPAVLAGVT